jgi:hypothetical protein
MLVHIVSASDITDKCFTRQTLIPIIFDGHESNRTRTTPTVLLEASQNRSPTKSIGDLKITIFDNLTSTSIPPRQKPNPNNGGLVVLRCPGDMEQMNLESKVTLGCTQTPRSKPAKQRSYQLCKHHAVSYIMVFLQRHHLTITMTPIDV